MPTGDRWLEVKLVVTEALELPAESRAEFLVRTCPDALHADAQQLLCSCEWASSANTFLDTPAAQFAASIIENVEQHPIDLAALQAELAGRYTIERELGRGGMATVYLARDERHGRRVALKVVHTGPTPHAAGSGADRFRREIEIAARLTHPHILPLHDSGAVAAGLYYVMPYVAGETLREHLARSGPLSLQVSLRVLRDVARALAHAHRQGIVHRDIKPGNILLNQDGDALVADFGVARAIAAARTADGVDAHDMDDFGTPAYSAPEQLTGESLTDQRADLYSFGVMAYEMLSGARPFTGRSTQGPRTAHRSEGPEPLTTRRPDVPPALDTLVVQLLARDPADRPQDAIEVLHSLDAVIERAEAGSGVAHATRHVRQRRVALGSAALLVMVVVLALLPVGPRPSAEAVELGTSNSEARQAYLRGRSLLERRRPGEPNAAVMHFDQAIALDSSFARAWAGLARAYTYAAIFHNEPRDDLVPRAREAVERALELDPELAEAHAVRAHQLFVLDCNWKDAEKAFERSLALDPTSAFALNLYGLFLHDTGRHDAARAQLHRARSLDPSPGAEQLLGRVFVNIGEPDSAIRYLDRARDFNPGPLGYQQLAHAYLQKGKPEEAIESMQRAAALNARDSAQLAYVYAATGDSAKARRIVQRLLDSESHRYLPAAGMVMAYAALGDADEAFRWLDRASCLNGLAVTAGFESIRSDPRFAGQLRRMGLR